MQTIPPNGSYDNTNLQQADLQIVKGKINGVDQIISSGDVYEWQDFSYYNRKTKTTKYYSLGTHFEVYKEPGETVENKIRWINADQPPEGEVYTVDIWFAPKVEFQATGNVRYYTDVNTPGVEQFQIRYQYYGYRDFSLNTIAIKHEVELKAIRGSLSVAKGEIIEYNIRDEDSNIVWSGVFQDNVAEGETKTIYKNVTYRDAPKGDKIRCSVRGEFKHKYFEPIDNSYNLVNIPQLPKLPTINNNPQEVTLYDSTSLGDISYTNLRGIDNSKYTYLVSIKSILSNEKIYYATTGTSLNFDSSKSSIVADGALICNEWNSTYVWAFQSPVITEVQVLYEGAPVTRIGNSVIRLGTSSLNRPLSKGVIPTSGASFNIGESLVVTNADLQQYLDKCSTLNPEYELVFPTVLNKSIVYTNVKFKESRGVFTFNDTQVNEMYKNMSTKTVANGNLWLNTYVNDYMGNKVPYEKWVLYSGGNFTGKIVDAQPTINASSFKFTNENSLVASLGLPEWTTLRGYFEGSISVDKASGKKGATITNYTMNLVNQQDSAPTVGTNVKSKKFDLAKVTASQGDASVIATDSRGFKVSASNKITIIPYTVPRLVVKAERLNLVESTTNVDISGSYHPVTVIENGSSVHKNKIKSISYRTKLDGGSWTSPTNCNFVESPLTASFKVNPFTLEFNSSNSYKIEVIVTDMLNSTNTVQVTVDRATPIFFIDADKNSIGVNKMPTQNNTLEVEDNIMFTGNLRKDNSKVGAKDFNMIYGKGDVRARDVIISRNFADTGDAPNSNYTGFEISGIEGMPYIDIHTNSSFNNDYDVRLIATGGAQGRNGSGRLDITSSATAFNRFVFFDGNLHATNQSTIHIRPIDSGDVAIYSLGGAFRPIRASAFVASSDVNGKTNLSLLKEGKTEIGNSALDLIKDTDVFVYDLKDELKNGKSFKQVGFISQLVPDVMEDGKGVNLYSSLGIAWRGIQELKEEVDNLKKELKKERNK